MRDSFSILAEQYILADVIGEIGALIDASDDLPKAVKISELMKHASIYNALDIPRGTHVEDVREYLDGYSSLARAFRTFTSYNGKQNVLKICRDSVVRDSVEPMIRQSPGKLTIEMLGDALADVVLDFDEPEIRVEIARLLEQEKIFIFKGATFEPWVDTPGEREVFDLIATGNAASIEDIQCTILGEDPTFWNNDKYLALDDSLGRLLAKGLIDCECDRREYTDIMGPVNLTRKGREKLEETTS